MAAARARFELRPDALTWLTGRNKNWRSTSGRPNITRLAESMNVNRSLLSSVASGQRDLTDTSIMAELVAAAGITGVTPSTAFDRLFVLMPANERSEDAA